MVYGGVLVFVHQPNKLLCYSCLGHSRGLTSFDGPDSHVPDDTQLCGLTQGVTGVDFRPIGLTGLIRLIFKYRLGFHASGSV